MVPNLNVLSLVLTGEGEALGVVPFVDGIELFLEWARTPVLAAEVLCEPSPLTSGLPQRVVLARCSCGNMDGSARAIIWADRNIIRWTDWQVDLPEDDDAEGASVPLPPPMAFDRKQYLQVVAEARSRVPPDLVARPLGSETIAWPEEPGSQKQPSGARSDVTALLNAVRAQIECEIERVDDPMTGVPGGDPSDLAGWHAGASHQPGQPGRPYYDPETWRWFELVDLAVLGDLVIVEFRWSEPGVSSNRYLLMCHVDGTETVAMAASIVRSTLRAQLRPGWRERLGHQEIGRERVLLIPQRLLGRH